MTGVQTCALPIYVSTSLPTSGVPTPSLSSAVPSFSGGGFNTPAPAATGFGATPTPAFGSSQSFNTTETVTQFSMTPAAPTTAPGGRRPVTPGFNL